MMNARRYRIDGFFSLVAFAGLALYASTVSAGENVWTTNGPAGADVRALAIDPVNPALLYAGTSGGGVFKSTDSGGTWTASNTGLTTLYIQALAVNPAAPATLYAGTYDGGVFQSTNGGRTWAAVNTGLTNFHVTSLAIDRSTPTMLYAGTHRGVFKSDDSGHTWEAVNTGLTNQYVYALTINPVTPATLYAGTIGPRVFKSIDSGATWAAAGAGLEPEHPATSPEDDPWLSGVTTALAIDPATPATLYAGTDIGPLFKSFDGGGSWTVIDAEVDMVTALAIDPANPATIYVGRLTGVVRSTDGGGRWATVNDGLTNPRVHSLAFDPSRPARLYAGTGGGVFERTATKGRRILPVVGSTPGANGTFFRTSVQLNNPGSEPSTGRIVFHPSGAMGSDTDPALSYSLAPGQTLSIADLLPAMGRSGVGSADIEITSGAVPVLTARVFNDAGSSGTTGFTEGAMRAEEALGPGRPGVLLIPSDFSVARFNIGVRTLDEGASVIFTVMTAAGAVFGSSTRAFPPDYHEQGDAAGFLGTFEVPPGGSITISVNAGAAIVYGATVDNRTGDPSLEIASWSPWDY